MEKRGPIPKASPGLSHELYGPVPTREHSHVKIKEINKNRKKHRISLSRGISEMEENEKYNFTEGR